MTRRVGPDGRSLEADGNRSAPWEFPGRWRTTGGLPATGDGVPLAPASGVAEAPYCQPALVWSGGEITAESATAYLYACRFSSDGIVGLLPRLVAWFAWAWAVCHHDATVPWTAKAQGRAGWPHPSLIAILQRWYGPVVTAWIVRDARAPAGAPGDPRPFISFKEMRKFAAARPTERRYVQFAGWISTIARADESLLLRAAGTRRPISAVAIRRRVNEPLPHHAIMWAPLFFFMLCDIKRGSPPAAGNLGAWSVLFDFGFPGRPRPAGSELALARAAAAYKAVRCKGSDWFRTAGSLLVAAGRIAVSRGPPMFAVANDSSDPWRNFTCEVQYPMHSALWHFDAVAAMALIDAGHLRVVLKPSLGQPGLYDDCCSVSDLLGPQTRRPGRNVAVAPTRDNLLCWAALLGLYCRGVRAVAVCFDLFEAVCVPGALHDLTLLGADVDVSNLKTSATGPGGFTMPGGDSARRAQAAATYARAVAATPGAARVKGLKEARAIVSALATDPVEMPGHPLSVFDLVELVQENPAAGSLPDGLVDDAPPSKRARPC